MKSAGMWRPWPMIALVAALGGWWFAPVPDTVPNLVKPRQDSWRLSQLPQRTDQTMVAAMVSGAAYWGGPAPASSAGRVAREDPRWRLAAVYGVGKERGALVEFAAADKPPLRLRVGDALPSGHRVVAIGDREICVLIGGKSFRLGVERSGS